MKFKLFSLFSHGENESENRMFSMCNNNFQTDFKKSIHIAHSFGLCLETMLKYTKTKIYFCITFNLEGKFSECVFDKISSRSIKLGFVK